MARATLKRTVIAGGQVYDHDGDTDQPAVADILIEGDKIARIGKGLARRAAGARIVDAAGKLVIPGFVNAHYHSHDVLLRGSFENLPTEIWFMYALPPSYPKRSKREVRARTLLAAAEAIRNGITTLQDMLTILPFDPEHLDLVLDTYAEVGLRVVFALQFADLRALDRVPYWRECVPKKFQDKLVAAADTSGVKVDPMGNVEAAYRANKDRHPRLHWALGPTNPAMCSPASLARVAAFSDEHGLPVYTHFYQSRAEAVAARRLMTKSEGSLAAFLKSVGLLNRRLTLAHSIWVAPDEINEITNAGAGVVLNIASNMKSKGGIPPIREYVAAGTRIALGSDNSACSDAQNMFQQMKLLASMAAVSDPEPGPPSAADALRYATLGGAATAGLDHTIGALKPGMKADLSILDLSASSFLPLNSAARQLVFTEGGGSVESVMVDGEFVMWKRKLTTIDEAALKAELKAVMPVLRRDAAQVAARNAKILPHLLEAHRRSWSDDLGMDRYVGRYRS